MLPVNLALYPPSSLTISSEMLLVPSFTFQTLESFAVSFKPSISMSQLLAFGKFVAVSSHLYSLLVVIVFFAANAYKLETSGLPQTLISADLTSLLVNTVFVAVIL